MQLFSKIPRIKSSYIIGLIISFIFIFSLIFSPRMPFATPVEAASFNYHSWKCFFWKKCFKASALPSATPTVVPTASASPLVTAAPTVAPTREPIFCTMDAVMCPDGSYVGRDPKNNCQAVCPTYHPERSPNMPLRNSEPLALPVQPTNSPQTQGTIAPVSSELPVIIPIKDPVFEDPRGKLCPQMEIMCPDGFARPQKGSCSATCVPLDP